MRLGDFATLYNGRAYKQNELFSEGKYPVLRVGNLFTNNQWYYSDLDLEPEKYCNSGDLLYSWSASFGPHIWEGGKVIYHYHIWKVEYSSNVDKNYLYYLLLSDTEQIKRSGHGLAMIHVTKAGMERRPFPLPPLAEQKRIVARIEELLPLLDRYEQSWSRLESFNSRFPDDMKKSLLQYAIQGKLVEQRSEEGSAEELYYQIQQEKQRLIAEGKIKKEKPLPEITEDEKPFDIPETWKWVKLGEISTYAQQKQKIAAKNITDDLWSLDLEDIEKESGKIINTCRASKRKISGDKLLFRKGQVLYSKLRPYLKKILVAPDSGICSSEIVPFNLYGNINAQYVVYYLKSPYADFVVNSVTYGVKMPRVGTDTMIELLIPLPPLAEQKRIVAKLEQLLPLCERLAVKTRA